MPGTYTFRPIQANLTHDTDWLGKMDPYCSYRVGPNRIKGPVCRNGGKFPKWEDATVSVPAVNEPSMVVDLMDKDKILFDDNIGSFVVDLQEIQSHGRVSKWYPVYWHKKPAGEILMEAAFQPEMIQQHQPVMEPVLVKETIVEPVIVEKVITEEVRTMPQQEFHSGPIIHGISQIHHHGQGHGLVPTHSGLLHEGTSYQQGSTLHQGSHLSQGGLTQGTFGHGLNQGLNQGTLHQGGLNQGLNQGTLHQGGLNQGLNQGSLGQGNLNQGGFSQGLDQGLTQGSLHQGGLNQGSFGQGNLNQGGFGQGLDQGLTQGTLNQGGLNQGLNQASLGQGSLNQGLNQNLNQGGLNQGNF